MLVDQPPSGGCVLKLIQNAVAAAIAPPAAFGRLCVETYNTHGRPPTAGVPAAFGRLCVETI